MGAREAGANEEGAAGTRDRTPLDYDGQAKEGITDGALDGRVSHP